MRFVALACCLGSAILFTGCQGTHCADCRTALAQRISTAPSLVTRGATVDSSTAEPSVATLASQEPVPYTKSTGADGPVASQHAAVPDGNVVAAAARGYAGKLVPRGAAPKIEPDISQASVIAKANVKGAVTLAAAPAELFTPVLPYDSDALSEHSEPTSEYSPSEVVLSDAPAAGGAVVVDDANAGIQQQYPPNVMMVDLPSALAMVAGDHPAVGLAQWRVQEAYDRLSEAKVLWLPSLRAGLSWHRHDGNYQASNGDIVDVNRSSLQYGFGAGGTGAGTTQQPGLRAQFHLADAVYQPRIARKTAWAQSHQATAVVNRQLLDVALGYVEFLDATQQLRIVEESRYRLASVSKLTTDFAEAGEGLQADADRLKTELALIDGRIVEAREAVDLASARLTHALSAEPGRVIAPADVTVLPLHLVSANRDRAELIRSGLSARPELKEAQALVSAACERHERNCNAPFIPSVLLGMSAGGFGGGTGNSLGRFDGRYDVDALMMWEVRNLGFGDEAMQKQSRARKQQAIFQQIQRMDDIARDIAEADTQVRRRSERLAVLQPAIELAVASYDRNLERIPDGEGLPLEVLQSVQALETARRAYAVSISDYNAAQLRLLWSMGWPISPSVQQ